jgi:hypothetical protein
MIFQSGSTTDAQNCSTGSIDYSGPLPEVVINDAIGALENGGSIFIEAGTYTFTTTISVNGYATAIGASSVNNIELYGAGNSTILQAGTNLNAAILTVGYGSGWYVHDLQINGNRGSQSDSGGTPPWLYGINFVFGSNDVVERCYVHDDKSNGINIYGGTQDSILDNWVVNSNANGITVDTGSQYTIQGNTVVGASDVGISIAGDDTQSGPAGLVTYVTCSGNLVKNINLHVSPYGINSGDGILVGDVGAAEHVTVTGNTVENAGSSSSGVGSGIDSYPPSSVTNLDVTISNNAMYNLPEGIHIAYTTSAYVSGNTIDGVSSTAYGSAVYIEPTGSNVTITGNSIENVETTNGYGIYNNANGAAISGNTISTFTAGAEGILQNANNGLIQDNTITDVDSNSGYALWINNGASDNTISDNVITLGHSDSTHIDVSPHASGNVISGNNLIGTVTGNCIMISSPTVVGTQITGNNFNGRGINAISDGGIQTVVMNNTGYNPLGHIASPFVSSGDYILDRSGASTPVNATAMTVYESPKLITVTIGSGWTSAHTLVIKVNGTQILSTSTPAANTVVFQETLQPGETLYIQYQTGQASFNVSGQ